ncbi:polysaccharide biosynthesis tyrosine autokinase [Mucilaginibacter sp. HMF5004]|uniref:GumC family protein n=1 Tax=Mucilaginibacter rivuli TaxID=2857527 RepID=UPI001C5F2B45|nr:tyrosine-protein kinase [Mucilaginibacter rivuli]MBW4890066.1 polysaccharide biosynthesis tyrosine autokinase [Mucilaginibacter rivuli]
MHSKKTDNYPMVRSFNEDDSFKPRETISKYLYHWPLFLLALLFTFSVAVVYLKLAKPVYDVTAELLIKEDNTVTNNSRAASVLQELDISETDKLVDNEIEVIKSRNLISQVVNDLQLWATYQSNKRIAKENLYGKSPVKITLLTSNPKIEGKNFVIFIKDTTTFYLTEKKGAQSVANKEYKFGTVIHSDFGTWKLDVTPHASEYFDNSIMMSLRDVNAVITEYQKQITVALVNKKSPTIGLSITEQIPDRGKDILNHLITVYNLATIADKNRITQSTLRFIDSRISTVSLELDSVEHQAEVFKSNRGITDINSKSRVSLEDQQDNVRRLNEARVKLQVAGTIENYVNSNAHNKSVPSTFGIDDPGLNSLVEKLTMLELDRDGMLANTPENNPIFDPINSQIEAAKAAIRVKITNVKAGLLSTLEQLQGYKSSFDQAIRNIPTQEREFIGIQRQQNLLENLYNYLLKNREQISLSYASTIADARIIDSAYAGPLKWPNKMLVLGMALIGGLVLPIMLLLFRQVFNDCIASRKEIENATEAPIVAEVNAVYARNQIIILDQSDVEVEEQFRFLRTKILLQHNNNEKGRVTLITSTVAREGKAFIGSNLGASLAVSGRKVIIIDLDLRRQRIAKIFDLPQLSVGLSDHLKQEATFKEIVQVTHVHPDLHVISNGHVTHYPTELIEHLDFENMIRMMRSNYDDIIIISPPLKLVTDAIILSGLSGVCLYVVRHNFSKRAFLPYINRIFQSNDLNKMNIVFNGIREKPAGYDYGKGYYPKIKQPFDLIKLLKDFLRRF